ncbi:hypothetical protein BIW11_07237 [Tropilaelaps mercedesae]|uniref:Uncharacterized protein n=1 Tax=Tropilaelaps mercedesae TaxID=418985 RepID=A0A1V9XUY9_9ACAR|nr:hypothetical protein BIW11_07237 [Tropilaelaps mercedesae]
MSSVQPLLLASGALGGGDTEEFGVIPEAEGALPPPTLPPHHAVRRDRSGQNLAPGQRQIKPRNIRTALKKLWLDEMLLTKQILCPVPGCTMVFQTLQAIQSHYQFCTGLNESGIVRCEFCGEQFLSQSLALEIHTAEEHRQDRLMSMSKADDQIAVTIKNEPHNSQQLTHHQSSYNSTGAKIRKYREPPELISIPSTPPPDVMIESRRRSVAFSRNQEELIDCEELEGVVRFPLRNLPKGEPEDPLQLPAVMMNLDINLKPRPLSFDDLDENSLMDDALLLAGPLKLKSEPLDKAEDDPHYLSDVINKMPEPDLKTVPPVRKRPRQQQHSSGPDVRVVQVIMRSSSSEPSAAQSILRDPQFVDAIVQQTMRTIVEPGGTQQGGRTPRRKKRKANQQPVVVVAFNEPAQEQTSPATVSQGTNISAMPPPVVPSPSPRAQGQPNIMKKGGRNRKQIFPPVTPPTGLVQVTSSLDPGHKFLQTHTLAPGDKPQVRQEVIDSFFNSAVVSTTANATLPTTANTCQQATASATTGASHHAVTSVAPQPSTSFVEDSSQLVQQQQANLQPVVVHQHQPQSIPHQQTMSQQLQHSHTVTTTHGGVQETFSQHQQQSPAHSQQHQQHQIQQQIVQPTEDFQTVQVVSSPDVLSHLGDQGCLIVPQEAFGQLEGAQLIVHEGQIIVQNKNGERVEGCQVVYGNAAFTTEATLAAAQDDFAGGQHTATLQQLQTAEVVGMLQLAQDQSQQVVVQQQDHHQHSLHEQSQPPSGESREQNQQQPQLVVADNGNGVVITQVDSPLAQVVSHTVAGGNGTHLSGAGTMASLVMSGQLQVIPVGPEDGHDQGKHHQQQQHRSPDEQTLANTVQSDAVQISIISMKDPDDTVGQHQVQESHIDSMHAADVQDLHDSAQSVVRHESVTEVHETIEHVQADSMKDLESVVVQGGDIVCGVAHDTGDKEDADTTATQAAEALLTLRPQNRCSLPASPLQLPDELQLPHRSAEGGVTDVDSEGTVKSGVTAREAPGCEEDEVFQMIPEPQTPSEDGDQSRSALLDGNQPNESERTEQAGNHESAHNGHVEMGSAVEIAATPILTATTTEAESDLVVVEAEKYSSVQA